MRRSKLVRLLTTLFLIGGVAHVPTAEAGAPMCRGTVERLTGGWTIIGLPNSAPVLPGVPAANISWYAADPVDPNRIFVADRASVLRTDDGGCTWKTVFSIRDVPPSGAIAQCEGADDTCSEIYSLDVGPTAESRERVYIQVRTSVFGQGGWTSHLFFSDDGGESFSPLDDPSLDGLMSKTGIGELIISPAQPNDLYLVREDLPYQNLFASEDAGATWKKLASPPGVWPNVLTVHPEDPKQLFGTFAVVGDPARSQYVRFEAYRSTDGGESWTKLDVPLESADSIAVSPTTSGATRIVVRDSGGGGLKDRLTISLDDGKTWGDLPPPPPEGTIEAMEFHGSSRMLYVFMRHDQVLRYDVKRRIATMLKDRPLGEGLSGWQTGGDRTGSGVYLLEECYPISGEPRCRYLLRFNRRGF